MVILGGKKPCVVELASNIAVLLASAAAPTITFPFTVALFKTPTLVKLDPVIVVFKEVPVKVPALAAIVISPVPSKAIPLIFLAVVNLVAVLANVAVAALPVILPLIGLVTVKLAKVPTDVKLELVTVDFKLVPVSVPASAVIVMLLVPSNATPLIFLEVTNFVVVAALPFTLPLIVLVTVKFDKVPTDVKLELTTVSFKEVPVSVPAFAAIVISPVPSNATPFTFMEVANFVVVAEFPVVD
jgi:hypothetical protein